MDLKNRHFVRVSKFFLASSEPFPPHPPKVSRRPGDSAQRLCDLGTSPQVSWEGATLENEVSDFSVFLCVLFCNGTSSMPSLNFS